MRQLSRRAALAFGAGGAAFTFLGWDQGAFAAAKEAADEIAKFTGGKTADKAKVSIELPEIAENGNTVPLAVSIDAPMTASALPAMVAIIMRSCARVPRIRAASCSSCTRVAW